MESILIWAAVGALALAFFLPYYLRFRRQQKADLARREEAEALDVLSPQSQYPQIDQNLCIGCGTCVKACPEKDVLGVVYGKAAIVNGLRCVGHGECEVVCPVGAIKVGLGDITARPDIPILDENYQSTIPGLYIIGELGGLSLIRNAVAQGRQVVRNIAESSESANGVVDILIVGAGPAGLAAALTAIENNLSYKVIDQQDAGGTILQYPRRKLVMTQRIEIPLYGWLKQVEYSKEDLLEIWNDVISKHNVDIESGHQLTDVVQEDDSLEVKTAAGVSFRAKNVVLALGRRGTPRKLGVPGEDQEKVMYQLIDAATYQNKHVLIVGGGDSAVEAAIALARQEGNTVTVSYRKSKFFRIKSKNEERINEMIRKKSVQPLFDTNVKEIQADKVVIKTPNGDLELPNDFVFVFAGGIPPFKMMKEMGIRFGGDSVQLAG